MESVRNFFRGTDQLSSANKSSESKTGKTGRPAAQKNLLATLSRFFSPERNASIARRVSDAVPSDATRPIKQEATASRASTALKKFDADYATATDDDVKIGFMLSAVRVAYHKALEETDQSGTDQFNGKKPEMTVSMLTSKLSKFLSNSSLSKEDMKYIQESVPRFEDKLPPVIRAALHKSLKSHSSSPEFSRNQAVTEPVGKQALQSPAISGRDAESTQISGPAPSPIGRSLTSEQAKFRSQFEGKLRQSLKGATAFPIEKVVATAGTVIKELVLDSKLTRENFSQKLEETLKKHLPAQTTEIQLLQILVYAKHAYDESIKP